LVSSYAKGKQPERALELFEDTSWQGVVPDTIIYKALISACEKGKQHECAREVFRAMQCQGLLPDMISIDLLILAHSGSNQRGMALTLVAQCEAYTLDLSVLSRSILLMECEQNGLLHTEVTGLSCLGKLHKGDGSDAEHLQFASSSIANSCIFGAGEAEAVTEAMVM